MSQKKWGEENGDEDEGWVTPEARAEEEEEENERELQDKMYFSKPKKPMICRFYSTRSGCLKGVNCVFSHEPDVCVFFKQGNCTNNNCRFAHDDSREPSVVLKDCSTPGCKNQCVGKMCRECHRQTAPTQKRRSSRKRSYTPPRHR